MWAAVAVAVAAVWGYGVRRAAFAGLDLYRRGRLALLRARGVTEETEAHGRVLRGEAWAAFCDELKAAGAAVAAGGAPHDALNQAEGYRYLSRVARAGLENFIEGDEPASPSFISIVDGLRPAPIKMGSDNPDNTYLNAAIDGRRWYRVWGRRGTVRYLGFGTQAGAYGAPGGLRTVDYAEAGGLVMEGDAFEIVVGPTRPGKCRNFLRTDAAVASGAGLVIVRQTFGDRALEAAAEVHIEPLDGGGGGGGGPPR